MSVGRIMNVAIVFILTWPKSLRIDRTSRTLSVVCQFYIIHRLSETEYNKYNIIKCHAQCNALTKTTIRIMSSLGIRVAIKQLYLRMSLLRFIFVLSRGKKLILISLIKFNYILIRMETTTTLNLLYFRMPLRYQITYIEH